MTSHNDALNGKKTRFQSKSQLRSDRLPVNSEKSSQDIDAMGKRTRSKSRIRSSTEKVSENLPYKPVTSKKDVEHKTKSQSQSIGNSANTEMVNQFYVNLFSFLFHELIYGRISYFYSR